MLAVVKNNGDRRSFAVTKKGAKTNQFPKGKTQNF
jgi:hypothetical protein